MKMTPITAILSTLGMCMALLAQAQTPMQMQTQTDANAQARINVSPSMVMRPALVASGTINLNAPVAGANSFTRTQIEGRLTEQGFSKINGLTKDKQGIWHGTAMYKGKPSTVMFDYQGNISVTPNR